jgi:hypothetical protein
MKILAETESRLHGQSETERGGTGANRQVSPDPRRTATDDDRKSRSVG